MNNSTRKAEEKAYRERKEKWAKLDEAERQTEETIFLSEYVNGSVYSIVEAHQNYQKYGGGFHMLNMRQVSEFDRVNMTNLRAEHGGCIYIELEQNMREFNQTFNVDYYNFSNLYLEGCMSKLDGGAMNIKNVRKMRISGQDTLLSNSYAFRSGGGINFECDVLDRGDCTLDLGPIRIANNTAIDNGGGIYW